MRIGRGLATAGLIAALVATGCADGPSRGPATGSPQVSQTHPSPSERPTSPPSTLPGAPSVPIPSAPNGPLPAAPPAAFYVPPDPLPPGEPGDLLRAVEVAAPSGTRAWAILYRSSGLAGEPIVVSGRVGAPELPAPDGANVIAYAHGTVGLADVCAPSRQPATEGEWAFLWPVVQLGFVVVGTDYQGLGTPGPHPYIVGESEGRSVLDAVRAAHQLAVVGAGPRTLLFGASQGGHAALWAGQLAASYAPELDLVGLVAAAPAGDLREVFLSQLEPGAAAIAQLEGLMVVSAWAATYDLATPFLTSAARTLATRLQDEVCPSAALLDGVDVFSGDPRVLLERAPWPDLLEANTPGQETVEVPILLLQGTADEQIPIASTRSLVGRLCAAGDRVDFRVYPGVGHGAAIFDSARTIETLRWVAARFAGAVAASTCGA